MSLSPSAIQELQNESELLRKDLGVMQAKAEKIRNRLAAIDSIIADEHDHPIGHAIPPPPQTLFGDSEPELHELPFRDAIRTILKNARRPLRPSEVRKELVRNRAVPKGNTDLSQRVANELYKLKKMGEVLSSNHGYFPK